MRRGREPARPARAGQRPDRNSSDDGRPWLRCYRCWSQNLEAQVHYDAILRIDPGVGRASPSAWTRCRRRSSSASTACTTSRT